MLVPSLAPVVDVLTLVLLLALVAAIQLLVLAPRAAALVAAIQVLVLAQRAAADQPKGVSLPASKGSIESAQQH